MAQSPGELFFFFVCSIIAFSRYVDHVLASFTENVFDLRGRYPCACLGACEFDFFFKAKHGPSQLEMGFKLHFEHPQSGRQVAIFLIAVSVRRILAGLLRWSVLTSHVKTSISDGGRKVSVEKSVGIGEEGQRKWLAARCNAPLTRGDTYVEVRPRPMTPMSQWCPSLTAVHAGKFWRGVRDSRGGGSGGCAGDGGGRMAVVRRAYRHVPLDILFLCFPISAQSGLPVPSEASATLRISTRSPPMERLLQMDAKPLVC